MVPSLAKQNLAMYGFDRKLTSPYKFYQFWLNTSDEDAVKYIKIFTLLSQDEVEELIEKHAEAPHLRLLQKRLGRGSYRDGSLA